MKKFVNLALSILTLFSLFAFTACDEDRPQTQLPEQTQGGQTGKTTVNGEEWYTALTYFEDASNYNFTIKIKLSDNEVQNSVYSFDYEHKSVSFEHTEYESNDTNEIKYSINAYFWQALDTNYTYSETKEKLNGDFVAKTEKITEEFNFEEYTNMALGDILLYTVIFKDKFTASTYDETTTSYSITAESGDYFYEELYYKNYNFFFENGKLVKVTSEENGHTLNVEISYNAPSVVIPQEILEMELGEYYL